MPGCLPNGASEASAPLSAPCPCAAPRGSAADDAVGVVDRVDAADVGEDVVELTHLAHLEREAVARHAVGQRLHGAPDDVHARVRERARDRFTLEVGEVRQLDNILANIRSIHTVYDAYRV